MATVNTVLGPLDTAQLGFTLMHEHVVTLSPGVRENWPQTFNRALVVRRGVEKMREARAAGIDTMVDLTTADLGRDVSLVAEIVREAHVQVVVATGIWRQVPRYFHLRSADHMADLFVHDITRGIQGTGVKAGIIKCATDEHGVTPPIELALRAAARAHRRTGVPISTHTDAWKKVGLDQQRCFREEGVDLGRVVIGHSGDTEDLDYLKQLLDAGSYIGMDRFGLHTTGTQDLLDTPRRVRVIAALCRQGYAGRMVLSHDASCHSDSREPEWVARHYPDWRYTHIPQDVLPALREAGVSEGQIQQMTRLNPRAIFEQQGSY